MTKLTEEEKWKLYNEVQYDKNGKEILNYIYKIVNQINGKIYIGRTRNIKKRMSEHILSAKKGLEDPQYKECYLIHRSFNKYGIDNFLFFIIAQADTIKRVDELEIAYIDYYKSLNRDFGYNMHPGGIGGSIKGRKMSDDFKKKCSLASKGRKLSEEHKKAFVAGNIGRKATDEQRKILSNAHKGINAGSKHPQAKLTEKDIPIIREMHFVDKMVCKDIAKIFNMSKAVIVKICSRKLWGHVP